MISAGRTANAVGGKTARACDSCLCKRARWFCPADDAFLCQACDTSVHSANQLARRHERVRLETSSNKYTAPKVDENSPPAWHQGFTRKARTPRHAKPSFVQPIKGEEKIIEKADPLPLVPEIGSEENSTEENEEQLLYRVPVFDPFEAELCTVPNENIGNDLDSLLNDDEGCDLDLPEFLASDVELAEFAADVESLLGGGLAEDSGGIQELGFTDCKEEEEEVGIGVCFGGKRVKVEDEDHEEVQAVIACHLDPTLDMERETFDWNFDYGSPTVGEEEEEQKILAGVEMTTTEGGSNNEIKRRMLLKLNYEEVMSAWASQGSPWTNGNRPEFNPDDCWPDFMGSCQEGIHHLYGGGIGGRAGGSDGGREARVSRYREKRRTRLFSKKIRYEVRKLNAEKRPRLKGRFVKRTSFGGPVYLMNK